MQQVGAQQCFSDTGLSRHVPRKQDSTSCRRHVIVVVLSPRCRGCRDRVVVVMASSSWRRVALSS